MQAYKYDNDGIFIEPEIILQEILPVNATEIRPPSGLYRPKWTGTEWIEGMSQEEIDELSKPTKEQEIINLKNQLEETDYQIIKCYEYQLAKLELPYDIAELHAERQELRDKINELENL